MRTRHVAGGVGLLLVLRASPVPAGTSQSLTDFRWGDETIAVTVSSVCDRRRTKDTTFCFRENLRLRLHATVEGVQRRDAYGYERVKEVVLKITDPDGNTTKYTWTEVTNRTEVREVRYNRDYETVDAALYDPPERGVYVVRATARIEREVRRTGKKLFRDIASMDKKIDLVEISMEIHGEGESDDLVRVKDRVCDRRHKVACTARVVTPPQASKAIAVVLRNPDRRLRFAVGEAFELTRTLSLPADGTVAEFEIAGEVRSRAMDDAIIEAHVDQCGPCTTEDATVFYFAEDTLTMERLAYYELVKYDDTAGYLPANGTDAIRHEAKATVKPDGLDCSAPQIERLRVGIVQNLLECQRHKYYLFEEVEWEPGIASGTAHPRKWWDYWKQIDEQLQDSNAADDPLYSKMAAKPPKPCAGYGTVAVTDTPAAARFSLVVKTPVVESGVVKGYMRYRFNYLTQRESYLTWSAIWQESTRVLSPLLQGTWSMNMRSTRTGQGARPGGVGRARQHPVTGGRFANDVILTTYFVPQELGRTYVITYPDTTP